MVKLSRRNFVLGSSALSLAGNLALPEISFANAPTNKRFVLVILRGGMDGLAAVPAYGDKNYLKQRGNFALPNPGEEKGILDLDGFFGLHPALSSLHKHYKNSDLAIVNSTALPYRNRSHFASQNVLETGMNKPGSDKGGWMNRMLETYKNEGHNATHMGLAIGKHVPLAMKGSINIASWEPVSEDPDEESIEPFLKQILGLYQNDEQLKGALAEAIRVGDMAKKEIHLLQSASGGKESWQDKGLSEIMKVLGSLLSRDDGPRIAVVESDGWDTHAYQKGTLFAQLYGLNNILKSLSSSLTDVWQDTIITVVTEFGRTVYENGTQGSDHGTASTTFLLGGGVNGGKIYGKWPGLSDNDLFEGRDLMPTTSLHSVLKTVAHHHLGIGKSDIDNKIFPVSSTDPLIKGLVG